MTVKSYRDLIVWQKAVDLVELIYRVTESFPKREMFGLANQMRRAAVSVPSNIAERQDRQSTRDFLHFLSIARGSLQEIDTQIIISERLKYSTGPGNLQVHALIAEVGRLLNGLCSSLVNK